MAEPIDPVDTNTVQSPSDVLITNIQAAGDTLVVHTNIGRVQAYRNAHGLWVPRNGGSLVYADDTQEPAPTDPGDPTDPDPVEPGGVATINDYPYRNGDIGVADAWAFYQRECVSFCCWRIRKRTWRTNFVNVYRGVRFGNAITWNNAANQLGIRVDTTPAVHSIAQRNRGTYGHVAYVYKVNADGTFCTEEYNSLNDHIYHIYNGAQNVGRFDYFIHFEDATP